MNISDKALDFVGFNVIQYLKTLAIVDNYRWNMQYLEEPAPKNMVQSMFDILNTQYHKRLIDPYKSEIATYKKMLIGNYLKFPKEAHKKHKVKVVNKSLKTPDNMPERNDAATKRDKRKIFAQGAKLS